MDVKKLDSVALFVLKFLNSNSYLKPKTLADVFIEKFKDDYENKIKTLQYLSNEGYISIKMFEGSLKMIHIDHLGKNYETIWNEELISKKKSKDEENQFKLITIFLSALASLIVSIIINLFFK